MAQIKVTVSATLQADAQKIYAILANYRSEHPQILPEKYFSNYRVEEGGVGEGTLIRYQTHIGGQTRDVYAKINEPEPERVLTETDLNTGLVTTFIVESINHKKAATVTIETKWKKRGIMGMIERLIAPYLLRPVYHKELQQLKTYAEQTVNMTVGSNI